MDGPPAASTSPIGASSLGLFARLPWEVRDQIWRLLLVGTPSGSYGKGSGIRINALFTNSSLYNEAIGYLYNCLKVFKWSHDLEIPHKALCRIKNLALDIHYCTSNRGDYEVNVHCTKYLTMIVAHQIAFVLRRSQNLESLQISLLNETQRKRGPKPLRSSSVKAWVMYFLRPYAALPQRVDVEIMGFEALDFAEDFAPVRRELAGTDMSTEELFELGVGHMR